MNYKNILIVLSFLLIAMLFSGSVAAMEDSNSTADAGLKTSNIINVDYAGQNHNEINDKTIKNAVDGSNDGDTITVNGDSYDNVNLTVDKRLTIKSEVGTVLNPLEGKGIFYLTSKASGTVIEGFNFKGDGSTEYGILINGASDVVIRNCTFTNIGTGDAIKLTNADQVTIDSVLVNGAFCGIDIIDSNNTIVKNSNIKNNKIAAVSLAGSSKNTRIIENNLTNNKMGIRLTSSDYVYVMGNYIAYNYYGVYVNCNVTKIEIKGNFFNQNDQYEVLNDFKVKNLIVGNVGYPDLEIIDNNYMLGSVKYSAERPVATYDYVYVGENKGDQIYDEENDVFKFVSSKNGNYSFELKNSFLKHVFEINKNVRCSCLFYTYDGKSWSQSGNYELKLSEITQIDRGVYSISIVDDDGNIAKELCSVPVVFYMNKENTHVTPSEGDVYKTVIMKNGTATVRFDPDEFAKSGNVITAVFPTNGNNYESKVVRTFTVTDRDIPRYHSNNTLIVSGLNTYPNSNAELVVTLKDGNGNPVSGQIITIKLNSKTYSPITDSKGNAKIKVSIPKEGIYTADITYLKDEFDNEKGIVHIKVSVKKQSSKIVSSNLNMIPKMAEYYAVTLKDASGRIIANQNIVFKVNGKSYTKTTDAKGVAKIKLKFSKNKKTYTIKITFNGNNMFKGVSKTNKLFVKYSSKTAKLTTPSLTLTPKTSKTYTLTLKDAKGKGISKQKVTVKINGKKYVKKTNSKGQINIKVKFSKLKTYKVTASYKGNKIYKKTSSKGKIIVAKVATKITAPSISLNPDDVKTYTVTLKTGNKALAKQKITIKLNGKSYAKTTNGMGQASISVKFRDAKSYPVTVNYKGNGIYKPSKATGKVNVVKINSKMECYDKTYSKDAQKEYYVTLKDQYGKVLAGQTLNYEINGQKNSKTTDGSGQVKIDMSGQKDSSDIKISYGGNYKYGPVSCFKTITISNRTGVTFVDAGLPNSEIQKIINSAPSNSDVEFLGDYYYDTSLTIKNSLNIYSQERTVLNAKYNVPVFRITAADVNISGFSIKANSGNAIVMDSCKNILIKDNYISNLLDEKQIPDYVSGDKNMPGYGISVLKSSDIKIIKNSVSLFESAVFCENSQKILIDNNLFRENNYGIKYGFGVSNTEIVNNEISRQTGLYIMTVPEGPTGYGIFLNNSAVNVTINHNRIVENHIGISIDAENSTGIVITQNKISDNVLEGIRFNAGYIPAESAVEPVVTDNAIYRNAKGPSMMILGEMSANPEGIYGPGQWNESLRLKLDANWYGTNSLITWDESTGVVGYGTMCPRISTTPIIFNLTCNAPGEYSIVFYKEGDVASNLPEFDMFATLNRGTAKEIEVNFKIIDGAGSFRFNSANYDRNNKIEISVDSLADSTYRTFKIISTYEVSKSEIPN